MDERLGSRQPFALCDDEFSRYLTTVAELGCPYIAPALRSGNFFLSTYSAEELTSFGDGSVRAGLLYASLCHVESLRRIRQTAGILYSDHIVISDSGAWPEAKARDLIAWPHWILKRLYSTQKLMFGKFWTGEHLITRSGEEVARPPLTFLAIRSSFPRRDPSLLESQPDVAALIGDVVLDDHKDVLWDILRPYGWDGEMDIGLFARHGVFDILKNNLT